MIGLRDDFSSKTKDELAKRVAYRCSNPQCRITTIGPKDGSNGIVNIGEAAHICAASPGGKRYDNNMSSEERSSYDNGIWLCSNCAAMIDRDENNYTVEKLHKWKQEAELQAIKNIMRREVSVDTVELVFISKNDRCIIEKIIEEIEDKNISYMLKDYDYHNDFQIDLLNPLFYLMEYLEQPSVSINNIQLRTQVQELLENIKEFRWIIALKGGPTKYGNGSYIIDFKEDQEAANDLCTKIWESFISLINTYRMFD